MLINFTFGNFRSFRNEKTLSMEATSNSEHKESLISVGKYNLLPTAVMYGANSSGKSNVIKAFSVFLWMVRKSNKLDSSDPLRFDPFLLNKNSAKGVTSFEIQFIIDGNVMYRYGFEYNKTEIIGEWLFEQSNGKSEHLLFDREQENIEISDEYFKEGKQVKELLDNNKLFLSLVGQFKKSNKARNILKSLNDINIINGEKEEDYRGYTLHMVKDHLDGVDKLTQFMNKLDLGFQEYLIEEVSTDFIFSEILNKVGKKDKAKLEKVLKNKLRKEKEEQYFTTKTKHSIYNEKGDIIGVCNFAEGEMESMGTQKIISLSGPIIDTLLNGRVLIIDELDAKLHPFLTREIVKLFTNNEINTNGAQLIFATHDTNLLDLSILRRDEIWFTEKDKTESSDLYSLAEFKQSDGSKIRKDASVEKNYINGRYGAIPFIN